MHRDAEVVEKCGIVAVWSKRYREQFSLALGLAGGVQHRGQQGAGFCGKEKERVKTHYASGLLKDVFPKKDLKKYVRKTKWSMIHCRYGTCGSWEKRNFQPCVVKDKFSDHKIVVIHNGQFVDLVKMRKMAGGKVEEGLSDTYLFAKILSVMRGGSFEERLVSVLDEMDGAFSIVVGYGDDIYLVRDRHGLRPFVMGYCGEQVVAASETHALDKVEARRVREVNPGAIIKVSDGGCVGIRRGKRKVKHYCDLERAYFSRPDSMWLDRHNRRGKVHKKWVSYAAFRMECGKRLADEVNIDGASFVVGVPDSGVAVANGYALASRLPYLQLIVRDHHDLHGDQRLFLKDDEKRKIGSKVLGKLSLVQDVELWDGAVVVICDDSLIRGNVSANISRAVFELGAKEVHWVLGFPPVKHRCHLGVSMRTEEELIAAKHQGDVVKIAEEIGASSVSYISSEAFVRAYCSNGRFKKPKKGESVFMINGGCGGCITGKYPV